MSSSCGYAVLNGKDELLDSFDYWKECLDFVSDLKVNQDIEVELMFWGKKTCKVTKYVYVCRYFENGGGISYSKKYRYIPGKEY